MASRNSSTLVGVRGEQEMTYPVVSVGDAGVEFFGYDDMSSCGLRVMFFWFC